MVLDHSQDKHDIVIPRNACHCDIRLIVGWLPSVQIGHRISTPRMVWYEFYSLATFGCTRDQRHYRTDSTSNDLRNTVDYRRANGWPWWNFDLQIN